MDSSSRSTGLRPSALRVGLILLLSANGNGKATAANPRQRALQECTIGDSFAVVAPAVPDMEGCYIWDDDYLNPAEGEYGYFHEEFGPSRPRYVVGGPAIGWELMGDEGVSCRSANTTSAPSYPVEVTWFCDPEEFQVVLVDGESDGFVELDPSLFSMVCDSSCPSAQVGVGNDDDTYTDEDVLDDDAVAGTVDDDLDGGSTPRSFTVMPSSAPTAVPSPSPDTAMPSIPLTTVAPSTSADTGDQPRSAPGTTSAPSASPTTADGGGDGNVGEGDEAESRAPTLAAGYMAAATGVFAAILAMVLVA